MTVSYNDEKGRLNIEMFGELGHHEAIETMENIEAVYECTSPTDVVLDMTRVSFMDSSGIAVVVKSKRMCDKDGATFSVKNAPKQALKVFSAAGITKIVSFI